MRIPPPTLVTRVRDERHLAEAQGLTARWPGLRLEEALAVVDEMARLDLVVERVQHAVCVDALGTVDYGRQAVYVARAQLARLPEKHTVREQWPTTWKDHILEDLGRWLLTRARSRWAPVRMEKWGHRLREKARWTVVEHDAYMFFTGVELPPDLREGRFATFFSRQSSRMGPI